MVRAVRSPGESGSAGQGAIRRVAVVAHTHWDREWYAPFERFRSRLTSVLDTLLAGLEEDRSFRRFLLDGQLAVVDDYLSVRPDAVDTIRRLAGDGRLAMGPWYVLMDEFCVSGETIVRNLQLGLRRAEAFGGAMPVGYLPDMFGHIAQMPQLLRLAGLEHAVVWRGVPARVDRTAFWWEAPDGSTVRAEYLPVGYANGAFLPDDTAAFLRRMEAHEAELRPFLAGDSTPLLLMNGTDHQPAQMGMPALLARANRDQDHFDFRQVSLPEYLAEAPAENLPHWRGELRSGARANILMGVLSNRVDVKIAAAVAERELERLAEPLAALWLPPGEWPTALLDEAWLAVIRNSAHDSICACSADAVGRAVLHRYDAATTLAREVTGRALALAEVASCAAGLVVVNPGSVDASGMVEVVLAGTEPMPETQVLTRIPGGAAERSGVGADLARILGELTDAGWLVNGRGVEAKLRHGPGGLEIVIAADATRRASLSMAPVMAEAWAQAGAHRDRPIRVRVDRRPAQRVLARVTGVPGYGWARFRPAPLGDTAVWGGPTWLDNSIVKVEIDPDRGTFSLNGLAGLDRLEDGGDEGDTYNYSPPRHDTIVDQPDGVDVELQEAGPVRGRLRVKRRFSWPTALQDGRRCGPTTVEVVTDIEVRAGEGLIRIVTSFDNPCRDRRLRAWFPLPRLADESVAECAFATVQRGAPEGGPNEPALATYPSRRFVSAGGLTITHEGLLEYELAADGTALALTLVRSTGVLARPAPTARPNGAGPSDPLTAPQLLGPLQVRYGLVVDDTDPWRLADLAWLPLQVVPSSGTGQLPASGSRLTVQGAEVAALRRVDGGIEVRVHNPTQHPAAVAIPGHAGWLVDLRGRGLERWEGGFSLRPWGIATARLDADTLDL
jgi:mannosylglycerate hydrolase